jgi:5'-nucleotidase
MSAPRILVVNDDGIHAPGIALLEELARAISDDVWVVAPEFEQSGKAHSLTLTDPIRLRRIDDRKFAVRGSPTDCVILACRHLMAANPPDLVLSGVNRGANLADDVTYSGTIAAAMEGALYGMRSIALSQVFGRERHVRWQTAQAHAPAVLERLMHVPCERGVFHNVNFPDCEPHEVRGVRVTRQGERALQEATVHERVDTRGFPYYWINFRNEAGDHPIDTDVGAIEAGYVSVTPLHCNLTHDPSFAATSRALAAPLP